MNWEAGGGVGSAGEAPAWPGWEWTTDEQGRRIHKPIGSLQQGGPVAAGETYLGICRPEELKQKIRQLHQKTMKKAGYELGLFELIKIHSQKEFWNIVDKMIMDGENQNPSICVETIGERSHG